MNTQGSIRRDYLRCTKGTSNKVYNMTLNAGDGFKIITEYGRYGAVLKELNKAEFRSLSLAHLEYDHILQEKLDKGYVNVGVDQGTTRVLDKKERAMVKKLAQNAEDGLRRIDFDL